MHKTVVIDTIALTPNLLQHTSFLSDFAKKGNLATIKPILPAVTCSVQSTYLTGKYPSEHGIVGNGWYFKDECEIKFWRQSSKLVIGEKIWDMAKKNNPKFTCANLFWWFNMYSSVDYGLTPRPMYPADGRKIPDIYTKPADIRFSLQKELGQFPLFNFWGPATSIKASKWIANAAKWIDKKYDPTLTLIYLPHLDYGLQEFGPDSPKIEKDLQELDDLCKDLVSYYKKQDCAIIFLSEYNIMPVTYPVHINRILRQNDYLSVREELGRELLDPGSSAAFAVSDHQVAHVYINEPKDALKIANILQNTKGIAKVLDEKDKKQYHLDHPRAGDLVAIAEKNAWFTYYYWLSDEKAPDFARTVEIHKKPGYDPVELFIDPTLKFAKLKIAQTILKQKLGFRTIMDVIPLDATLVKGSHGLVSHDPDDSPVFITSHKNLLTEKSIDATNVCNLILKHLTTFF